MAKVEWKEAQRVCDLPAVDEAIRNLLADQTGDNATCMVREILEAVQADQQPVGVWVCPDKDSECGNNPSNWCPVCPRRAPVKVDPAVPAQVDPCNGREGNCVACPLDKKA